MVQSVPWGLLGCRETEAIGQQGQSRGQRWGGNPRRDSWGASRNAA